jgi:anti-sigma factor RsiW
VSHLGTQISALVDGELTGAELDRANAHLATCKQCRAEAAELRQLKRELGALAWACEDEALTRRLLAMAGPGGPVPSRRFRREQYWRARSATKRAGGRPRAVLWSALSLVIVGVGAAAFNMGGASAQPGPKITPQVEMFSIQHAVTSGDVPFPYPTQVLTGTPSP